MRWAGQIAEVVIAMIAGADTEPLLTDLSQIGD
jgi:hypothetical protein